MSSSDPGAVREELDLLAELAGHVPQEPWEEVEEGGDGQHPDPVDRVLQLRRQQGQAEIVVVGVVEEQVKALGHRLLDLGDALDEVYEPADHHPVPAGVVNRRPHPLQLRDHAAERLVLQNQPADVGRPLVRLDAGDQDFTDPVHQVVELLRLNPDGLR